MLRIGKSSTVAATVTALAALWAGAVPGTDDGLGAVECSQRRQSGHCDVGVGTPGREGQRRSGGSSGDGSTTPDRCSYRRVEPQLPPPPGTAADAGGWYVRRCLPEAGGLAAESQPMWLAQEQPPDPDVLAMDARSMLQLPVAAIATSPDTTITGGGVLVGVPVWLWIQDWGWGRRQATAAVPGLSVTATATAVRTVWRPGDGTTVHCGKGVGWVPGIDPRAPSPQCGYTYIRAGRWTMTATVAWRITWAGGGQSGTLPDLTGSATRPVAVTEAPALNTAGRR